MVRQRIRFVLCVLVVIANGYPQDSCRNVREFFLKQDLVPESDLPLLPIEGSSNGYCEGKTTCCTQKMESDLSSMSEKDFRLALQATSASFKDVLAKSSDIIHAELAHSIRLATIKTQMMFLNLYERVAGIARQPIDTFFADLERSLTNADDSAVAAEDNDIESIVLRFFDDLYPKIYSQSQNGAVVGSTDSQREFTDTFAACMKGAMSEIRPFGEMPKRIASTVTRSLETARELTLAFRLTSEVVNATDNIEFSAECRSALMKSGHCAQCAGLERGSVRWCRGLCMNVARGCLAPLADVDKSWNEVMDILAKVVNGVEGVNLVDVMNSLDSRLSEAVLYSLESGVMFDHKIKSICGPQDYKQSDSIAVKLAPAPSPAEVAEANPDKLHSFLQTVLSAVTEAKGFYANVADSICSSKNVLLPPTDEDTNCWNGLEVGEYSKTIGGIGLAEQKYNPEVRIVNTAADSSLVEYSIRLHQTRQNLAGKLIIPADLDSLVLSDQGSGSGGYGDDDVISDRDSYVDPSYRTYDPDDGLDGSGSGDGGDDENERVVTADNGPAVTDKGDGIVFDRDSTSKKPAPGGGNTAALSLTLLLVTILITSRRDV